MFRANWLAIAPALLGAITTTILAGSDDLARDVSHEMRQSIEWLETSGTISPMQATLASGPLLWGLVMLATTVAAFVVCRCTIQRCPRGHSWLGWQASLMLQGGAQVAALVGIYYAGWYRPVQATLDNYLYEGGTIWTDAAYDAGSVHYLLPMMTGWALLNLVLAAISRVTRKRSCPEATLARPEL